MSVSSNIRSSALRKCVMCEIASDGCDVIMMYEYFSTSDLQLYISVSTSSMSKLKFCRTPVQVRYCSLLAVSVVCSDYCPRTLKKCPLLLPKCQSCDSEKAYANCRNIFCQSVACHMVIFQSSVEST